MPKIFLMRHGMTEHDDWFGGPDIRLSARGQRQIAALCADMKSAGLSFAEIWHSPFERTVETARIAAEVFWIKRLKSDDRLKEWQVGKWFDRLVTEFNAATGYDRNPPPVMHDAEIETMEHMAERVVSVIEEAREQAGGANDHSPLLVAHREPMVSALLKLQGKNYETIHDVSFPRASVWEIIFGADGKLVSCAKVFDHYKDE
ncbi:MAG: histidine phosphatase family protein [Patescibacteria group bacterium]